ncbi:MAG: hypothetical protein HRT71_09380, partial [Flavobacteriales bacterium]|nr:hypothetical protein [Flavobacteriales bacterium]
SNTDYDTTGIEVTVSYIEEIFSSTSSNYQANAKSISNNSDYKYSQEHNLYIEELFHLFDDTLETSHATLFQSIVLLEKEIEQNERLTEQELISLFSATQVAQHSYTYWSYHFEDWLILGDITKKHGGGRGNRKPNRSSTMGHRALNIAKGDVGGALAGAAGAWAVNIVPGMGQVAYGGAILGASVAGSTGAAFMEITNYFGW